MMRLYLNKLEVRIIILLSFYTLISFTGFGQDNPLSLQNGKGKEQLKMAGIMRRKLKNYG